MILLSERVILIAVGIYEKERYTEDDGADEG
jgi:hypothetical protein